MLIDPSHVNKFVVDDVLFGLYNFSSSLLLAHLLSLTGKKPTNKMFRSVKIVIRGEEKTSQWQTNQFEIAYHFH